MGSSFFGPLCVGLASETICAISYELLMLCSCRASVSQGIGFRNWKKRWFVLKGAELVCYKDGGLIETVGLRGCTIKRGKVGQRYHLGGDAEHGSYATVFCFSSSGS